MRQRVAVITGGGRGIGRAASLRLARDGFRVWVADIDGSSAAATAEEINGGGGSAESVVLDVAEPDSVTRAFDRVVAVDPAIDVLVNNAAIVEVHSFEDIPVEAWERVHRVNVVGMYLCIRAFLPALRSAPPPARIINMASGAGKIPGVFTAPYHASKAAVISLTRTAAAALAPGVLVNSLCPGIVDTDMWVRIEEGHDRIGAPPTARFDYRTSTLPLRRPGTSDEVAAVIAFLAGEDSGYITGEDINVAGGSVMH